MAEWITTQEFAQATSLTTGQVNRLCQSGKLEYRREPRRLKNKSATISGGAWKWNAIVINPAELEKFKANEQH